MQIVPGILLVFAPLFILGAALAGEACVQRLLRHVRRWQGLRHAYFG